MQKQKTIPEAARNRCMIIWLSSLNIADAWMCFLLIADLSRGANLPGSIGSLEAPIFFGAAQNTFSDDFTIRTDVPQPNTDFNELKNHTICEELP